MPDAAPLPDHAAAPSRGNPKAAQARIELRRAGAYEGQRRHDLRTGPQPAYVDQARAAENDVIIEPPRPGVIRETNEARRAQRATQRAMKKDGALAFVGILTFGHEAAATFAALPREKQNAAFRDAAQAIADRLRTTVAGLVVHRDETTPHAHFVLPAYDLDGNPLSKTTTRAALQQVQTLTAEAFARHAPGIERGFTVSERAAAGADKHDLRHRSVRELHADLPAEVAAARAATKAAQERADEMAERVRRLEAKAELTTAEVKRMNTYRKRLEARNAELEAAAKAAETVARAAEMVAAKAREEAAEMVKAAAVARAEAEATRAAAEADARIMREEAAAAKAEAEAYKAEVGTLRDTLKRTVGAFKTLARKLGLTGPDADTAAAAIDYAERLMKRPTPEPAPAPKARTPEPEEDDTPRPSPWGTGRGW